MTDNWLTFLPSPSRGTWHLGPIPLRAYALCLLAGIVVAGWIGARRLAKRGYAAQLMFDVALWAVPFGIVGAKLYHVLSSPKPYFGSGGHPLDALKIWQPGLSIWGSIALGAVGGIIAAKRCKIPVGVLADALAPGIAVGQAVGRFGNWFNQELFGKPTTLPWGLQVSDSVATDAGYSPGTLFHPTFAYEALWCVGVAVVLVWAGKRFALRHGQVFFAYMVLYCAGRGWIETLRVDPASQVLGLRINVWTSILLGLVGVGLFVFSRRKWRGEPAVLAEASEAEPEAESEEAAETEAETDAEADGASEAETGAEVATDTELEAKAELEAGLEAALVDGSSTTETTEDDLPEDKEGSTEDAGLGELDETDNPAEASEPDDQVDLELDAPKAATSDKGETGESGKVPRFRRRSKA